MAESTTLSALKVGLPLTPEEIAQKGPPTRDEIEAISAKYGMGMAISDEENARYQEFFRNRRNATDLATILGILYPTCEWKIEGKGRGTDANNPGSTDYENLVWDDDNPLPKPTLAELDKYRPFVQDILDQEVYIRMRKIAYPSESSLIRALWEYVMEGNRTGVDALQARRLAVKKRFPKPENKHWMVQSEDYMKILPNAPYDILRQMDEETAQMIAFMPGVEAEDALPLSASMQFGERVQAIMQKRAEQLAAQGKDPDEVFPYLQPTVEDVQKAADEAGVSLDPTSGQ